MNVIMSIHRNHHQSCLLCILKRTIIVSDTTLLLNDALPRVVTAGACNYYSNHCPRNLIVMIAGNYCYGISLHVEHGGIPVSIESLPNDQTLTSLMHIWPTSLSLSLSLSLEENEEERKHVTRSSLKKTFKLRRERNRFVASLRRSVNI